MSDTTKPTETKEVEQEEDVKDVLARMTSQLKLGEKLDREKVADTGDKLLLLWIKSMPKNAFGEDIFESIHELLHLTDTHKEYLPYSFLSTFHTALNLYLVRHREYLIDSKRSYDLLMPAVQLMQFSVKVVEKHLREQSSNTEFSYKPRIQSRLCLACIMTLRYIIDVSRQDVNLWIFYLQTNLATDSMVQFLTLLMKRRAGPEICLTVVELLLCLSSIRETADYLNKAGLINQVNMIVVSAYERPYTHLSQLAPATLINANKSPNQQSALMEVGTSMPMSNISKVYLDIMNSDHDWLPIYWHVIRLNVSMMLTLSSDYMTTAVEFLAIHCIRMCELLELLRTKPRSVDMEEALQMIYMINLVLRHGCMWKKKDRLSYDSISDEIAKTAYTLATSALPPPTAGRPGDQQRTSIKPRDCLVYARCCYDFGKYTEAERVLFQTKFGDKSGFIKEAVQLYGEELSIYAFHLAALIYLKTNRQSDSVDFAIQVFAEDPEYLDIVSAMTQNRL